MSQIEIYQSDDNQTQIEVQFENDTVWLTQSQIVELYKTSKSNVSEHLKSIFESAELDMNSTVRKFRTVRLEGKRKVERNIEHYNLDVIISLGYRVNTKMGVRFRQWASQRLKDYLVKGYAINSTRLEQLQKTVKVIEQIGNTERLQLAEARGLLEILSNYTRSFILLSQYDSSQLEPKKLNVNITYEIKYKEARAAITELKNLLVAKKQASKLFGNEKDSGFRSSLKTIVQTFDGKYLYPSIEQQAAHLFCN